MNKEEVLKELFMLPKEDILDIECIIKGYRERVNKSSKDTLLARCLFASGYHNTKEFYEKHNITKDEAMAQALGYGTTNVKTYLELKRIFNIDDIIFSKVLEEAGGSNE